MATYYFTAQTVLAYYRTATGDVKASSTHQHGAANDSVTVCTAVLRPFQNNESYSGGPLRA